MGICNNTSVVSKNNIFKIALPFFPMYSFNMLLKFAVPRWRKKLALSIEFVENDKRKDVEMRYCRGISNWVGNNSKGATGHFDITDSNISFTTLAYNKLMNAGVYGEKLGMLGGEI